MKKYSKIGQFRDVIKEVNSYFSYHEIPLEPLKFYGKVKLHGTNAGIGFSSSRGLWTQKRRGLCTVQDDNYGFATYVERNKEFYLSLLKSVHDSLKLKKEEEVLFFGEWAGPGIQNGVAISQIKEKSFFLFEVMYKPKGSASWLSYHNVVLKDNKDHDFYYIPVSYEIDIDFLKPNLSTNQLIEITEKVEKECPYTKLVFGISGIGEGVVWTGYYNKEVFRFKVKGEKHSVSKVKKLATVDPELVKSIEEFIEYVVTDNRVIQGIQETNSTSVQDIGKFLKWFGNDVISEEKDILVANQLEWKQVVKKVNSVARNKFFKFLRDDNTTK